MEQAETEIQSDSTPKKKGKKKIDDSEFQINMNRWGIAFFILSIAVIAYIVISASASLPPFVFNVITEEFDISEGLLTGLLVIALVFLGLGIYFGWIKKPEEKLEEQEGLEQSTDEQITFVIDEGEEKDTEEVIETK
jgi:hypothetical protein